MDISSLSITLPTICSVGLFFIGLMTFFGNRRKSSKDEEARLVRIETMTANIEKNTSTLSQKVDDHDHSIANHDTRITVLEARRSTQRRVN